MLKNGRNKILSIIQKVGKFQRNHIFVLSIISMLEIQEYFDKKKAIQKELLLFLDNDFEGTERFLESESVTEEENRTIIHNYII